MPTKFILAIVVLTLVGWILHMTMSEGDQGTLQRPVLALQPGNSAVVSQGKSLYSETCAACHGTNLEGQTNWRQRFPNGRLPAPPHDETGHTWHHPDVMLFQLTKYGTAAVIQDPNYQSDMPAYEGQLTDEEIIAILSYIKSRWPEAIQRQHDQINERAKQSEK